MNYENKNNSVKLKKNALLDTYGNVFSKVPRFITNILSISFVAYIVGWVRANSYYSEFGAKWIVAQLNTNELLQFSIWPFLILGLSFFIVTEVIAENKTSYKKIVLLSVCSIFLAFMILILNRLFVRKYFVSFELALAFIALFALGIAASLLANQIVLLHSKGMAKQPSIIFSLIPYMCFIGFYILPNNLGEIEGQRDIDIIRTQLPRVVLRDSKNKKTRLLRYNGSEFFIVRLPNSGDSGGVTIQVVDSAKILKIIGREQKISK